MHDHEEPSRHEGHVDQPEPAAAACRAQGVPSPAPATTRPLGDAFTVRGGFAIPDMQDIEALRDALA
jgi:hypothetical protein